LFKHDLASVRCGVLQESRFFRKIKRDELTTTCKIYNWQDCLISFTRPIVGRIQQDLAGL
jgi:hypothetical protein